MGLLLVRTEAQTGRLTGIDYPVGTPDVTFEYDDYGRRTNMLDGTGTTVWSYNAADELTTFDPPGTDLITYSYRPDGQRATMVANSQTTTYTYDGFGRPTGLVNPHGETTEVAYDILGRVDKRTFESDQFEDFQYDSRGRLTRVRLRESSGTVLRSQEYVYDAASRITSRTTGGVRLIGSAESISTLSEESGGRTAALHVLPTAEAAQGHAFDEVFLSEEEQRQNRQHG